MYVILKKMIKMIVGALEPPPVEGGPQTSFEHSPPPAPITTSSSLTSSVKYVST